MNQSANPYSQLTVSQCLEMAQKQCETGNFAQAQTLCREILHREPENLLALNLLGTIASQEGDNLGAIAWYQQAVKVHPNVPEFHYNLANSLKLEGQQAEAIAHYCQAIILRPNYTKACYNLGNLHLKRGEIQEAIAQYQQAIALDPQDLQIQTNLGNALKEAGDLEAAIIQYRQLCDRSPDSAEFHYNLGVALHDYGDLAEAIACYDRAIAIEPHTVMFHWNRALSLLISGDYPRGFVEYEWRWQTETLTPRPFPQPIWDGSPLTGRSILLHSEQGLGDTLQFIRYIPLVAALGGRIILECYPPLFPLLQQLEGVDILALRGESLPAFDVHAPLMSLPRIFGTTLDTIPRDIPYLMVRPPHPGTVGLSEQSPLARAEVSSAKNDQNPSDSPLLKGGLGVSPVNDPSETIIPSPSFKIGIVWAANHENPTAIKRSCPFSYFCQLIEEFPPSSIEFYSLQKDSTELTELSHEVPIQDLAPQLNHFRDTAEVMAELDLIITVDTAVAHLAGALGKPAWVLLPFAPDWRWLLNRPDSPWYPTLRLFRQSKPGDWQSVFDEVKQALIEALELTKHWAKMPPNLSAKLGRGIAAHHRGDLTAAERLYRQVLEQMPNHPVALTNWGMLLKSQGNCAEAVACYHQALPYAPQEVGLHYNLGNALWELGKREAAIAQFHRVIVLQSNHVDGYNNLGMVLHELGELEPAIPHFEQAVALNPNYAQGYNNLGLVLHDLGKVEEAIACYNTALRLQPDYSEAHNNRGIALLIQGDLRQGFREYEWRWRVKAAPDLPPIPAPFWDGSDLRGKTILLHAEQGLGDCIQFVRYAALLVQRGGRVVALVNQPLVRLFESVPGIARVSAYWSDLAPIDVWIPLLSLPHILGTTLATVPGEVPYLTPTHLAPVILDAPGLKVGIVWAGNPQHKGDRTRSCPLRYFLPLLNIPGVEWYSLQKGQEETRIRQQNLPIEDLAPHLQDLADTAAVIAQLDLVITVDTSVAHLAGALGKPVWVALSYAPDWRWLLNRTDSPWYPTMRLFRQEERGDWQGVFDEVAQSLTEVLATRIVFPEPHTISPEFALARQDYEAGNFADAQRRCRVLLRQYPNQAQGWQLLGAIAHQGGKINTAVGYYKQALIADCRYLPAYINLGAALRSLGRTSEAISYLAQAVAVDSHSLPAHYNLGNALSDEGHFQEAIAHYRQVIALDAHHSQAHYHLGNALKELGNLTEAVTHIQEATTLDPNYTEAHNTLGNLLLKAGRITEAMACFQRATALDSQYIDAHINLGTAFQEQHQTTAAIATYHRALEIQPDSAEAHLNLAISLLTAGDLRGGFAEYEWRWCVKECPALPHFDVPQWEGTDLTGKTLLLYGEQGLGDTLQFIRYAPLLAQRGIRVVALVAAPLVSILKTVPGIEAISSHQEELEPFESWIPLMSLPRIFGTTLTTIPATIPYIHPSNVSQLPLKSQPFKVGMVWAGNPKHHSDYKRSCSLDIFQNFLTVPGVEFYSLQKGQAGQNWQGRNLPLEDLGPSLDDFADTAAAISQLDLIITVDTSVAHLAGAMGKPTWLLLAYTPDWRWGLEGSESPWYPSLRLFRQTQPGDWQEVGDRITQELRQTVANFSTESIDSGEGNQEILEQFQQMIVSHPNCAEAYYNLGNCLKNQDQPEAAIAQYHQAIALKPNYLNAYFNLGNTYLEINQPEGAIAAYETALTIAPNDADTHTNLGFALLMTGDYSRGFAEYEWRNQRQDETSQFSLLPAWDGSDFSGKTLLLYTELGFGDSIQFIRYLPQVAQRGGRVILQCPKSLIPLFSTLPCDRLIPTGEPLPPFDITASLMSLPYLLGTTLDTIPATVPYLTPPNPPSVILESPHFKVGIVWAGSPRYGNQRNRSCPLEHLLPLGEIPGVTLYSLQKGQPLENPPATLTDLSAQLEDFADTAGAIAQLDLVITIDTAVAHLAGALGKPVWVLLPFAPDWRWMRDRSDSPWYPTLRLFRQTQPGNWQEVCDRVAVALGDRVSHPDTIITHPSPVGPKQPRSQQPIVGKISPTRAKTLLEGEGNMNPKSMMTESMGDRTQSVPKPAQKPLRLGLAWPINQMTGWGIYGTNLTLQLQKNPGYEPMLLLQPDTSGVVNPLMRSQLKPACDRYQNLEQLRNQNPGKPIWCDFPVLHALGNNFSSVATTKQLGGKQNIGLIFFEDTNFTPEKRKLAQEYLLIVAGSTWNAEVLKSQGITTVQALPQGIDPTWFHPAPKSNLFGDRFVIFSGGKLEYRKGQDIVIAAFKAFQQRHPEALLITAWHNFWPQFMRGLETTGHVTGLPKIGADKRLNLSEWLLNNGLNPDSFIDIGAIPNYLMPQIIREADCALFTNRCEGGTNLVAMETMACGIPTILSANTGHLDLIDPNHCYPLKIQKPVQPTPQFIGVEGWGESDIEEIIETLETLYQNRENAQQKGIAAAQFMQQWTWENQVNRLLEILGEIL
ncbi:tetratricopeptide repeat protein [Laspinema sp. D1]|uniref:Tetratricopeptide repeat protein n=1 Tax=Laspinema palackyanum D2a TaxID=2953684 RepID=A0ABT2MVQ4_9CYAN|nr:tetratricopeptide repeat protein [Laspinema sp. D2a]